MFFERRLSDEAMCDPPTRPKLPSLLSGRRYSAEANAARADRWRARTALRMCGGDTEGRKARASAATDASSAASDAACDAREAQETELGVHEANATRSSQVVVSTTTSELESETWVSKRVPWARTKNVVPRDDAEANERFVRDDEDHEDAEDDDDDDDALVLVATRASSFRFPDDASPPVPSRRPLVRTRRASHVPPRCSLVLAREGASSIEGARAASANGLGPGAPRRRFAGGGGDAPRGSAPEPDETTDGGASRPVPFDVDDEDARVGTNAHVTTREPTEARWREASRDATRRADARAARAREAPFSPFSPPGDALAARPTSRAFAEAVAAVEREDKQRMADAARFVERRRAARSLGSRDGDAARGSAKVADDAENAGAETAASAASMACADVAIRTREKNAAALAALRLSLERNAPPAPPPVRTRVSPREKPARETAAKTRASAARRSGASRSSGTDGFVKAIKTSEASSR